MNIYSMSTTSSTLPIEQELQAAREAGARMETIQAIEKRLEEALKQNQEEDKHSDITFIKLWSNHYLLKHYAEVTAQCDELMTVMNQGDPGKPEKEIADRFDTSLKLVEQIEDEGQTRGIAPFIPQEEFQNKILRVLAEISLHEGFVPAKRIAEAMDYPIDPMRSHIEEMFTKGTILQYMDDQDLWAVSVATREQLGITKNSKKEGGE
jgi:hypothetical protein